MNLSEFKAMLRIFLPGAKSNIITDPVSTIIINSAARDIAAYTCCLKTNKKFTITENQAEYNLSTVLDRYLTPDKPGLWWNNGTKWVKLNPRTLAWLDEFRPNWRDLAAGTPQDYSIDGDILTIVPKSNTTLADGLWFYYGQAPTNMSEETHYPFSGSDTEYTHLSVFDDAILAYCDWKINPILSKDGLFVLNMQAYEKIREEKTNLFKKRRDINADRNLRLQGPNVRQ